MANRLYDLGDWNKAIGVEGLMDIIRREVQSITYPTCNIKICDVSHSTMEGFYSHACLQGSFKLCY
jgi:hypothetical protein